MRFKLQGEWLFLSRKNREAEGDNYAIKMHLIVNGLSKLKDEV
jgi:hypothetical protein